MFLSPVYVKRSDGSNAQKCAGNRNKDSGTQTSKTIIELAQIETGYISPDSLDGSPPRTSYKIQEMNEDYLHPQSSGIHQSKPNSAISGRRRSPGHLKKENSFEKQSFRDRKNSVHIKTPEEKYDNCEPNIGSRIKSKNEYKEKKCDLGKSISEINMKKNDGYWSQLICPPAEPMQENYKYESIVNIERNVTTLYNRNDAYSTICEEDTPNSRDTCNITSTSSSSIFDKNKEQMEGSYFDKNKEQMKMEDVDNWREQIGHKSKDKNRREEKIETWREDMFQPTSTQTKPEKYQHLKEPEIGNLMDSNLDANRDSDAKLDQYLTKKISQKQILKQEAPIDAFIETQRQSDSPRSKRRTKKSQVKDDHVDTDKRVLHFYKNKEGTKGTGNTDDQDAADFTVYSGFQNRRSNSFMNPTLASEQKSQKQVVDSVKNLVGMTCKGRSISPQSNPKSGIKTKIPYIDQSRTDLSPRPAKSDIICKHKSDTSIVGSSASSDNGIFIILSHIKSSDWNYALKGLAELLEIGKNSDPETLLPFLTMAHQRLLELLRSPRSHVCRTACQLSGHFFEVMKDTRRPEFDDIVNLLLYKTADANKFIRQDANLALDCMVTHIPTFHAIRSLCAKGPNHRNPLVRCASIRLLICAIVIAEPNSIFNSPNHEHSRRRIILNLAHFLEDKNLETRKYAERLYLILAKESNFDFYMKKYIDRIKLDSFYRTVRYVKKA